MGLHRVGHDWRDLAAAAAEALKTQQAKEILVAQAKGNFPKCLHQNFPVSPSEIIKELIDSKFQLLIKKLIWSPYYPLVILTMQKAIATHSSTLAWKIPWTEEPGGLQSMGSRRVGHDWTTSLHFSLSCIREGNGNQCSCLENPRDGGAWWAAVYGVAQSQTWLKRSSSNKLNYKICLAHYAIIVTFRSLCLIRWLNSS